MFRVPWQALQWPSPSTRYAPRFHSALSPGFGLNSPALKYRVRQPSSSWRWLYGKRISCGLFGWLTGGSDMKKA